MNEFANDDTETVIFIVDDKLPNLRLLSDMLKQHGYNVRGAPDGSTALKMIHKARPDLILLDIRMPGMDGFEVCRRLKEDDETREIPVIFISALGESPEKIKAFGAGGVDYITKPFQIEEVLARVRTHLTLRDMNIRLQREIAERKKAEEALRRVNADLETRVQQRTAELAEINEELKAEMVERSKTETALREREAQLRHAQKMEAIGALAGGIAHDFNNILSAIFGYTEISLRKVAPGSDHHECLSRVLDASRRARDLVKQILTFSRQTEQELTPVKVSLVVKEALKLLRASLPSTIELRKQIHSSGMTLADPTQIHQVLMNLCTNAAHAMGDRDGVLSVSLDDVKRENKDAGLDGDVKPGACIRLTVGDTGHGMPPETMERIFDPFFTTKRQGEGVGMGLSVVHGIVKNCGGAISVDSTPGKGSVFHVFFPSTKPTGAMEKKRASAPLPHGKERILYVDDEPVLVDLGRKMLEEIGYSVVAEANSVDALALFSQNPDAFDLVVSDLTMPHMKGDRLAREIMAIRPDTPVILCTGFSENVTPAKVKAMGVKELVMKPIVMEEIARIIRRTLNEASNLK